MESDLVEGQVPNALRGNRGAFDALYRMHHPQVRSVVLRRVGQREDAEDLVQTTFLRAYLGLRSFRGGSSFSTWVTRIAINVCNSHLRRRATESRWVAIVPEPEGRSDRPVWHLSQESPEQRVIQRERQEQLTQLLDNLPAKYRDVMALRYLEDRTYAEIRDALGVPMGSVKIWLHRARNHIRKELGLPGPEAM